MKELDRIDFIIERDGLEAALKFSEQGVAIYVEASVRSGMYKSSIKVFTDFLAEHGRHVEMVKVVSK